jgi:hypothetical protein
VRPRQARYPTDLRSAYADVLFALDSVNQSKTWTHRQFAGTIRNNERASYNGSIEASQASDVGSIPIARSRNSVSL